MTKIKKPKVTKADLRRKLVEMEAQLAHIYHFADAGLKGAGRDRMMASGVLITMHALGGREIIPPVVIKDGLSQQTLDALRMDLSRSFEQATIHRPSLLPKATAAEINAAFPEKA